MQTTVTHARALEIPEILIEAAVLDGCLEELVNDHIESMVSEWRMLHERQGSVYCEECSAALDDEGVCPACQKSYERSIGELVSTWKERNTH